ncbi:MAG: hypothetical protein AB1426_10895 [Bacillota bacterium]
MIDRKPVFQNAINWMLDRGWKRLGAKRKQFDQSLFEHTLIELDVALQLLPILKQPSHFNLTTEEEQILVVSLVAHDIGKERPEWQDYLLGRRDFVSDVDPELTRAALPDLCSALGFSGLHSKVMAVIENCVNLHMSHERRDANVVLAIFQGADRWYTLANLVYHIDNICSAKGVFEAKAAFERSILAKHLRVTYHQVSIRGVSTTALHRAALDSFQEAGWTPLLHFSDATLYVCSAAKPVLEPRPDQIEARLVQILKEATGKDVTQFIVGSPTANILPKPDLFEYSEILMYLEAATRKIGRKSFAMAYEREKKRVASGRPAATGRGKSKAEVIEDYWARKGKTGERYSSEMDRDAERISTAHPNILAFKLFKAAMKPDFIGDGGVRIARQEYEAVFGAGSWDSLLSTSTLMPAQDMAKTVDLFWQLPGQQFGLAVRTLEELAPEKRTELLVDTLAQIAGKVYAAIPNPPTRATLARKMAASFIHDLVSPAVQVDLSELARQQMEFYAVSKSFAGKQTKKARYICPVCNTKFEEGVRAKADFIDNPESHTNRGIAHGPFGYITLCKSCYYERILRQLLLGERAAELIIVFPRMNVGPGAGELLVRKAEALYNRAYALMVGDTDDPDRRLWLAFTSFIAEQMMQQDLYRLAPEQFVDLLTYRSSEENRRKNRRELEKRLQEQYEGNLEAANDEWGRDFKTWAEATEAVYANQVADPIARQIRADVYRLYPQMQLVCQTPHMIILPVNYTIKLKDDSEANAALRRTFVALLLGLNLDASVAIVRDSDQIDFQGGEGVAFVPAVATVRELIGSNWVPLSEAERWLRALGIASILANAGQYSVRSGLFEVLTAPTAGHVLRRIEQKKAMERQPLTYRDITYLRVFAEVMQR